MAEKTLIASTKQSKNKSIKEYYFGNGKRKTSTARVRLYKNGKGNAVVNDRQFDDMFPVALHREVIMAPIVLCGLSGKFDLSAKVNGGGINSSAEAIRHGVARALIDYDESLKSVLKKAGYLTRDSRIKERKKPGLKRARRAPQFSKR